MTKIGIDIRTFEVIDRGQERSKIKEKLCFEQFYDHKAAKKLRNMELEKKKGESKGNVRVFGYKHPKVMKLFAKLFLCLKDCMDQKPDDGGQSASNLAVNMNGFMLIKNELSL